MTPEEWLAQADAVHEIAAAMTPIAEALGSVAATFRTEGGFSAEAAEQLTVQWAGCYFWPTLIAGQQATEVTP